MAWVRVDDDWPTHPKVMGLGLAASGLWIRALCHCNKHRTDGLIRGSVIVGMVGRTSKAQLKKVVEELVGAGLWVAEGENFRIHDYAEYQPTSSELAERDERISSARRSAGSSGGKRSAEVRRGKQTGSKTQPPIPYPIPISTTTLPPARAHVATVDPPDPPPPTSPSPTTTAPLPVQAHARGCLDDTESELPFELAPPIPEPPSPRQEVLGSMSVRGTVRMERPVQRPSKRTQQPPVDDTSPRAIVLRTMLDLEPYRQVEESYGANYDSPLIEIFADHCLGTAGTIGCPMDRLPDVVKQVAIKLSGTALLHGAPPKPDSWLDVLGKYIAGAKKWTNFPLNDAPTQTPRQSPAPNGGRGGKWGGTNANTPPRRSGPAVQRDLSGACTSEAAQKHYTEHADELEEIGERLGF